MTPADLLAALLAIFPSFEEDWAEETAVSNGYWDDTLTFQRIVMAFCQYFGVAAPKATRHQLLATAKLVNDAVEAGGKLEIAVSTGLLEHLHQIEDQDQNSGGLGLLRCLHGALLGRCGTH
jgi:hypothetical protein